MDKGIDKITEVSETTTELLNLYISLYLNLLILKYLSIKVTKDIEINKDIADSSELSG